MILIKTCLSFHCLFVGDEHSRFKKQIDRVSVIFLIIDISFLSRKTENRFIHLVFLKVCASFLRISIVRNVFTPNQIYPNVNVSIECCFYLFFVFLTGSVPHHFTDGAILFDHLKYYIYHKKTILFCINYTHRFAKK